MAVLPGLKFAGAIGCTLLTDLVVPHRPMEKRAESTQITYTFGSAYHFRTARPKIEPALSNRDMEFRQPP
jgi:hypothetical protein